MAQGGDPLGNGTGETGQNIDTEFSSEKHVEVQSPWLGLKIQMVQIVSFYLLY